jgi:hypothetical protein
VLIGRCLSIIRWRLAAFLTTQVNVDVICG